MVKHRRGLVMAVALGLWMPAAEAFQSAAATQPVSPSASAPTGRLVVQVQGLENTRGRLIVRLFGGPKGWLEDAHALRRVVVKPTGNTAQVVLDGVPAGRFAVTAVHDENQNGELDMSWFPFPHPDEGAGASNNIKPRFGPLSFATCAFTFAPPSQQVLIKLFY